MTADARLNARDPLAGLNPHQLLAHGLAESADAPTQEQPSSGGFVPLSVAELQALLPQFEILELIGRGGMGAVYKARQTALDRLVAIKVLPPQVGRDPAFAERFSREAKALARLGHPGIVAVHDAGSVPWSASDRIFYFVMEYVDGASLRDVIRAGKLPPAEALAIVPQICEALQFAHDEGIVHRDIKPDNILLDARGRVKIADFGLAKLLDQQPQEVTLTGTHQVMGTLRCMAPEQMEGKRADHRADIYSLGVVFYELLTGEVPLGRFEPPSHKVQLDIRLDDVVLRSLAREPEKRYQTAGAVKSDVESISKTRLAPTLAQPSQPEPKPATFAVQIMPRDAADLVHMLAFIPVVMFVVFVVPAFLMFLIVAAAGQSLTTSVFIGGQVGLAVTLGLFVILGMGSIQGFTVDGRGITIRRFFGPGKFLAWDDITRIRLMKRWEVVRQVWIWPGLPPRGSIMGVSSRNYFSLDARDGCWYVCPTNAAAFIECLREFEERHRRQWLDEDAGVKGRAWDGEQPYVASFTMLLACLVITLFVAIVVAIPAAGLGVWMAMRDSPLVVAAPVALPTTPGAAVYYQHHQGVARDLAVTHDGRKVVTVGDDGNVVIRDLQTHELKSIAVGTRKPGDDAAHALRTVAMSNTSEFAYVAGNPRQDSIFKVHFMSGAVLGIPYETTATVNKVFPTVDDKRLLCLQGDRQLDVVSDKGKVLATAAIYPGKVFGNVRSVAMSPSGAYTAVTSSNLVPDEGGGMKSAEPCQLTVFDLDGNEALSWKIPDYADFSSAQVAWADDKTLLLALPSGTLQRFTLEEPGSWKQQEPVRISPGSYHAACLSEDGRSIWLATDLHLWAFDYETGKPTGNAGLEMQRKVGNYAAEPIEAIAVVPGRDLIAAALWDGRLALVKPFKVNAEE